MSAPVNPWIGSVLIDNKPVDLDRVLASLTIRHGRDDPDGPIQSSSAAVTLRGIPRDELYAYEVGLPLAIRGDAAAGVDLFFLFAGNLTDLELDDDDPAVDAVLSMTATSTLATSGDRPVRGHAWPAELWGDRMRRILTEAGLYSVVQTPSPDVPIAATLPDDPEAGTFATMSCLDALEAGRDDVGSTVFDQGDGSICVQAYDSRASSASRMAIDAGDILYSPPWTQTLNIKNRIVLGYAYGAGSVTVDDEVSQELYGLRWTGDFATGIADQTHALERATAWLTRLAYPKWALPGVTLLRPYPLAIGNVVELPSLPGSAPFASWEAVIEGWTETIEGPSWTQELVLSDPQLSGLSLPWQDLPGSLLWQNVNPAARWRDAYTLANLTGAR